MNVYFLLQILAGMLVLSAGSGLLIASLVRIAKAAKIQEYLIAFLVVALGASVPEIMLALAAQSHDIPEFAFLNSIGTGIVSITFVAGMIAIFKRKIDTHNFFQTHDYAGLTLSVLLLLILSSDGRLSRFDGFLLLLLFIYYLLNLLNYKSHLKLQLADTKYNISMYVIATFLALASILLAADFIVFSTVNTNIASKLELYAIALTLIAPLGVIPELIFEFELIRRKTSRLTYGDMFTSVVINLTFVTAILALINPFTIAINNLLRFAALFFVVMLIIFNYFMRSRDKLSWKEGVLLVLGYVFFLLVSLLVQIV